MPAKPPLAGELRHRVTVEEDRSATLGAQPNAYGERVPDWRPWEAVEPDGKVWAKVMPLSGRELFLAQQVTPDVTHEVWLRHSSQTVGLTAAHRLVTADGRVLNVESCQRFAERGFWWYLVCREQT